jgi:hypothetical protein
VKFANKGGGKAAAAPCAVCLEAWEKAFSMTCAKLAAAIALMALASTTGVHAQEDGSPSARPDAIVIVNSGSTNFAGYRIVVDISGHAKFESGHTHGSTRLPGAILSKLKYDVVMAQPLSHVRARSNCAKSASFGSSSTVSLGPERTEDLSCAASPRGAALNADVSAVAGFLGLTGRPHDRL